MLIHSLGALSQCSDQIFPKYSPKNCYEPVVQSDGGWPSCWYAGVYLTTRDSGTREPVEHQDVKEQDLLGFPSSYDNLRRGLHWNFLFAICFHAGILFDLFDSEDEVEIFFRNVYYFSTE